MVITNRNTSVYRYIEFDLHKKSSLIEFVFHKEVHLLLVDGSCVITFDLLKGKKIISNIKSSVFWRCNIMKSWNHYLIDMKSPTSGMKINGIFMQY